MPPKRAFYIAQDTPNVSPKLGPVDAFPLSRKGGLPIPSVGVPGRIRRPKKILYLFVIFFLLYWFGIRHGLGREKEERGPPTPLGFALKTGERHRPRTMVFLRNGIASLLPLRRGAPQPEHPVYELMERGEELWRKVRDRQSKTLKDAVKEYRRRYGIDPPAGFDEWFKWAQEHNVELVDEYDLMMRDVLAHHALKPETFIGRSEELSRNQSFAYTLHVTPEEVTITGERAGNARPKKLLSMVDSFKAALPKGFSLNITGSDHDVSGVVLGKDQRKRAMELVRKNKCAYDSCLTVTNSRLLRRGTQALPEPGALSRVGLVREYARFTASYSSNRAQKACPIDSPANRLNDPSEAPISEGQSFIHDHLSTMDFCEFPRLKVLHGALQYDREDRSPSLLKPWLVHSKLPGDASFLLPPIEGFTNLTEKDIPKLGTWDDKLDHRVHWRGSTTGGFSIQQDWRQSHRMRLHFMFNDKKGNESYWGETFRELIQPDGQGGYERVTRNMPVLAKAYGDVQLSGKPIQCSTDKMCEEIRDEVEFGSVLKPKDVWMFRYFLDVDGNGWSERFHRLLSSASPVMKMTIFADWHMVSYPALA